jgi:3-methyl-2-oxobutanoate hydroxymethyltransferase
VIADLPFMSYQVTAKEALTSAGRMMKEAGVHAVKLEGGAVIADTVKRIIDAGIPVMGHLGLTPQSIYKFGTYKVRAREEAEAEQLLKDAKTLEGCGVFSIVLEKIPAPLAARVTESVSVPTIGIGAGPDCDGQVLVLHDMLGLNKEFKPRFLRRYADVHTTMTDAVQQYIRDVKSVDFPGEKEQY